MTELDDAIMTRIKEIVYTEHRPVSYIDMQQFEVNGKSYCIAHGTIRNKISELRKKGKLEREYNSKVGFYTLVGVHFGNAVTHNHMGLPSVIPVTGAMGNEMEELLNYLKTIPVNEAAVHDIHYKFVVPDIYAIMSSHSKYRNSINPVSKDILLTPDIIDGLKITTIIHCTDTVTVSIACSKTPIPLNEAGILATSCALTRVEERLSSKLDECGNELPGGYERIPIPDNRRWTITLWHFGKDAKFEYANKGFSLTWGHGREVLRTYPKVVNGQRVQRNEKQEYPDKPQEDAFKEKRNKNDRNG